MIYNIEVVGHPRKDPFEKLLNAAVQNAQANFGHAVEIEYGGKQHGYWSALVIAKRPD